MRTKDQILLENAYGKIYESTVGSFNDEPLDLNDSEAVAKADVESEKQEDYQKEIESEDQGNLIDDLKEALKTGASFVSFMYKSKGTGDTSIFNVNLNVDYKRVKEEDLQTLKEYQPENEEEQMAKDSILNPKKRNVIKGDPYDNLGKGIKLNTTTNKIHVIGWVENKELIQKGEPKIVNKRDSSDLTIAKNALMKKLNLKSMGPTRKIRNFILDQENISGLRIKGNVIEFQS